MSRPDPTSREMAPCKDCVDRREACWGKCEKYKTWKAKLEAVNAERKKYSNRPFVQYNPYDY